MARGSSSTLIEWGGILIVVFFFLPRVLAALSSSNRRTDTLFSPGAAAQAQAARAINTAGLTGNTALGNFLSRLLGSRQQQPQQQSGRAGGSTPPGGGSAGQLSRTANTVSDANTGGIPPQLDQLFNRDGTLNIRQPDFMDYLNGTGPYQGNTPDVTPPQLDLTAYGGGLDLSQFNFGGVEPVGPSPDVSGLDYGGDLSGLYSVFGADAAGLSSPDVSGLDSSFGGFDFTSMLPDPTFDYGGGSDFSSSDFSSFDFGGGGFDWFGGGGSDSWDWGPSIEEFAV